MRVLGYIKDTLKGTSILTWIEFSTTKLNILTIHKVLYIVPKGK